MASPRLLLWILVAWPLPALLAGALGWSGVWGSGSALFDYLIPIPVAGGALHVPSFVLATLAVARMASLGDASAGRLRVLLLGVAVAGLLLLLRLDDMWVAWRTQSTHAGGAWQENPVGLFLLCDATLALLFTASSPQRPWLRVDLASAALMALPIALAVGMALQHSHAGEPFMHGMSRQGESRGDEVSMMFTRLDASAPDFRARAEAWAAPMHPRLSVNSDDVAILFTRNLDAARRFDTSQVTATLCLYEDGTPPLWLPGARSDDCFGRHVSFSEQFALAYAARPAGEPPDLRDYLARKSVCAGVAPIPASGDTGGVELSATRICTGLPKARETLRLKYPDAAPQIDSPP
jgi:hypothetical protein